MNKQTLYTWKYEDTKNRSPIWYIVALSVAIGLIIWWFLTRQYWMSLVIMLVSWFFFFLENNSEDEVSVEISDLGILVQEKFYDYAKIAAFSIIYDGSRAVYLKLYVKKSRIWFVNLSLDNNTASNIRPILTNFVQESEKQEITLSEKIIHFLKL